MTTKRERLELQINNAGRKLVALKSKYITLYGYGGLKMNPDGTISEIENDSWDDD
jgi:hypothetical protein